MQSKTRYNEAKLLRENQTLRTQLEELRETFRAIRHDEVDALVIRTLEGDRVFTLRGADQCYRTLIEQMKEGAVMLSSDKSVLYSNSGFANMLNQPLDKILLDDIRHHIEPTYIAAFRELLQKGKSGIADEIAFRRKDGTLIPTMVSVNNLVVDGVDATYLVVTDLTEHMAEEVKRYTDRLEEKVIEKTQALKSAERFAAIGETAGMVGHDMRNPLQTIVGELYLAKEELKQMQDGSTKQNLAETLNTMEEQALYMNKIVNDLQDYAKVADPELKPTNIHKLVKKTLRSIKIPKTIDISVRIPKDLPPLMIDPSMTERILANLISNAIQAIPEKGVITVQATRKKQNVILNVKDTGVGIPDEIKAKMFRPLFTTKAKGQGFGLAVVKRFVEAQRGKVAFKSQRGIGTSFTVTIPFPKHVAVKCSRLTNRRIDEDWKPEPLELLQK